jgi:hypothetical protein
MVEPHMRCWTAAYQIEGAGALQSFRAAHSGTYILIHYFVQ